MKTPLLATDFARSDRSDATDRGHQALTAPPSCGSPSVLPAAPAATATARPGRPYTGGPTPIRHIRISDAEWTEMRSAAVAAGDTLSSFVRAVTLRAARRINERIAAGERSEPADQ